MYNNNMNKLELKEYLEQNFATVLENKNKTKEGIEETKTKLGIEVGSIDDRCYVWKCDFVCKNEEGKIIYIIFYSKKKTLMTWDDDKKCINTRLDNNVTKRYMYKEILSDLKKDLPESNSFLVIYSIADINFNPKSTKNHVFVCNEANFDSYIGKYMDTK